MTAPAETKTQKKVVLYAVKGLEPEDCLGCNHRAPLSKKMPGVVARCLRDTHHCPQQEKVSESLLNKVKSRAN